MCIDICESKGLGLGLGVLGWAWTILCMGFAILGVSGLTHGCFWVLSHRVYFVFIQPLVEFPSPLSHLNVLCQIYF